MRIGIKKRLAALESPIQRAHNLVRRRVPVRQWPLVELTAFCDESPQLKLLSDDELRALLERDDSYDDQA